MAVKFRVFPGASRVQVLMLCALILFLTLAVAWGLRCKTGLNRLGAVVSSASSVALFATGAPGSVVTHSFTVRNSGLLPLSIESIEVPCSCTTATVAETNIAPGGRTLVTVAVRLPESPGSVEQTVWVRTNDRCHPRLALTLKGECGYRIGLQPARLEVRRHEKRTIRIESESRSLRFRIRQLGDCPDGVTLTFPDRDVRSHRHEIEVLATDRLSDTCQEFTIRIATDAPLSPVLSCAVRIRE